MGRSLNAKQIMTDAVATGVQAGHEEFGTNGHVNLTFFIVATNVTTGANIKIQGSGDDGVTWVDITADQAVGANGSSEVTLNEYWPKVRSNISARTDGTYNVFLSASGSNTIN